MHHTCSKVQQSICYENCWNYFTIVYGFSEKSFSCYEIAGYFLVGYAKDTHNNDQNAVDNQYTRLFFSLRPQCKNAQQYPWIYQRFSALNKSAGLRLNNFATGTSQNEPQINPLWVNGTAMPFKYQINTCILDTEKVPQQRVKLKLYVLYSQDQSPRKRV